MIKIIVKESEDDIKNNLSPIKHEVCIVNNRRTEDIFILTYDENTELISNLLSIVSVEEFTDKNRVEFIMSENDYVMIGRSDFLQ